MRAMRLKKREVTDKEELIQILEACDVVRIGAEDGEGMFIVPVNYGYEKKKTPEGKEQLFLYFHSAKEGRKAEAFAKNPAVAFEMDCPQGLITGDYTCAYSFAFCSIMGNGMIRKLENEEEKRRGLECLMRHMAPQAEIAFTQEMLDRVDVYCVEVISFTGKKREKKERADG